MNAVISALIIGIIAMFAVVLSWGIYSGQSTTGWPSVLVTATSNIPVIIALCGILAMLLGIAALAAKVASSTGSQF